MTASNDYARLMTKRTNRHSGKTLSSATSEGSSLIARNTIGICLTHLDNFHEDAYYFKPYQSGNFWSGMTKETRVVIIDEFNFSDSGVGPIGVLQLISGSSNTFNVKGRSVDCKNVKVYVFLSNFNFYECMH
jgi:hypothetical protein